MTAAAGATSVVATTTPRPIIKVAHDPTSKFVNSRSRDKETEERYSPGQAWRAQVASPYFWSVAEHLPWNDISRPTGGRYRDYPDWMMFLLLIHSHLTGSVRSAITYALDPAEWQRFVEHAHYYVPDGWTSPLTGLPKRSDPVHDAEDRLRGRPLPAPRDQHIAYWMKCWRTKNTEPSSRWYGIRTTVMKAFKAASADQAMQQGLLDPDVPMHWQRPFRDQSVNFDGTVIPARRRRDGADRPGCQQWSTGDDKSIYGTKFVTASTRGDDYKSRVVLGVAHITNKATLADDTDLDVQHSFAGESASVVAAIKELITATPGMRYTTCDSVLRGNDVETVQALGIVVVNWPHAASNPGASAGKRHHDSRVEKSGHITTVTHPGGCSHRIFYQGGAPYEETLDAEGTPTYRRLHQVGYQRRPNKNGTFRHYALLNIPCPDGDTVERVAMFHTTGPSGDPKLNRGEVVRLYPTDSPQFKHMYGRRNDTESWHADFKRMKTHFPGTIAGQELFMLSAAMAHNAIAHAQWRKTNGLPNAFDNTA